MKKVNNKGFSLVELIIVIAIMAILIGVLAPQYIKYVEKSRISSDKDMVDSLLKAGQTLCTDDDYYTDMVDNYSTQSITINKANGIVVGGDVVSKYMNEVYGYSNNSNQKFKSKAFSAATVSITFKEVSATATGAKAIQAEAGVNGSTYDPELFK